jgi:hypothetical protein
MKFLAALGIAALLSAPAIAAEQPCLRMDQIWSWKVIDHSTLIVEDTRHRKFKVTLMIPEPDLSFKERIGFKSIGGTELSCLGPGDDVLVHDIAMPRRDPIQSIVLYTPQMEAADKAAAAAKAQQSNP